MLRVTVELVPHGSELRKRVIGVMTIANRHTNERNEADYNVVIENDTEQGAHLFTLKSYNRGKGFWALIRECLKSYQ